MDVFSKVWLDGRIVNETDARVPLLTHSLQSGMAIVEGIRCYATTRGRAFFRLDAHLRRLFDSAKILGIQMPFSSGVLERACRDVVVACDLAEAYVRPLVFLGHGALGIAAKGAPTRVAVMAWRWGAYLGEDGQRLGVRAKISSFARSSNSSWPTKAKVTGGYVNSVLAKHEALEQGYDEAIFLDSHGYVAEGTGENIFIVRDGRLITTPLPTVLGGITRDTVLRLAEGRRLHVEERLFTRDELYTADEAFFTGTAAELTPIREVDGRPIGAGEPGPVTTALRDDFATVVHGANPAFDHWLALLDDSSVPNSRLGAAVTP